MKVSASTAAFGLAAIAALATTADAHGQMTSPEPRPVTDKFRADCGALKNAGDDELQIAPVENLSGRSQSDFPEAATFNLMNGCRGFVYEEGNTVTTLTPGTPFDVEWTIQAPHPGYMNLSIVKPETDSAGKITYVNYLTLLTIDPFANTGGTDSTTATIPAGEVTGCETAGDCALQFYWHSDLASQTYPTCADIIVSGSGAGTGSSTTPTATTTAPSSSTTTAPSTTTATPTATTAAPSTDKDASASVGGEEDGSEYDDEYATDAPSAPAATSAPAPTAEKCNVRRRERRE